MTACWYVSLNLPSCNFIFLTGPIDHIQIMMAITNRHTVLRKFKSFKQGRAVFESLVKETQQLATCMTNMKPILLANETRKHATNIAKIVRKNLNPSIGCEKGTTYFSVPLNNAVHVVPLKMEYLFRTFRLGYGVLSMQTVEHVNKLIPKCSTILPKMYFVLLVTTNGSFV